MKKNIITAASIIVLAFTACSQSANSAEKSTEGQIYKVADSSRDECLAAPERAAFNTRVLQTELMEAALSCSEHEKYNSFVKKYKKQLMEASKNLQAYFKKVYGPLADAEMNRFVTKMANDTSEVNFTKQKNGYCVYADDKFDKLKNVKPEDLSKFVVTEHFEVTYKTPGCKEAK